MCLLGLLGGYAARLRLVRGLPCSNVGGVHSYLALLSSARRIAALQEDLLIASYYDCRR
jgi:hypothetical protein